MGMAVDPAFTYTRQIYVCMVSTLGAEPDVRLIRWQVNADYTALTNRADIVTGLPVNVSTAENGRHSGCRPRFGPDDRIYVGTGDAALGSAPQDPGSLGGKVLRVDRSGLGVPGNPGGGLDPRIWSTGHRNVQGIAFRASDGLGVSSEHGPDRDDELNRLTTGNFGWDSRHPNGSDLYYEGGPMTDLGKYPSAKRPIITSGSSTYAPAGATFVTGSQWAEWDGALLMTTLKGASIRSFELEASTGNLKDVGISLTGYGRLRSITQGPGGDLYVGTSNGSNTDQILRLTPR